MSKMLDMTGKKINYLSVIERAENSKEGKAYWVCRCDCGNITTVSGTNLRNGSVKSCGCLQKKSVKRTHCMSKSHLYNIWNLMKFRCQNPKSNSYNTYGGRGITVCDEWLKFENFAKWAIDNGYQDGLTIDRIDNNKNYCPDNCRWIPKSEQAKHRSFNYSISYLGKEQTLKDWCDELNLNYKRVHNRMVKLGWSFEKAIKTPVQESKRNMEARNKYGNNT